MLHQLYMEWKNTRNCVFVSRGRLAGSSYAAHCGGEKGQSIGTLKRSDWLIVSHTGDSVVTVKFQLSIL